MKGDIGLKNRKVYFIIIHFIYSIIAIIFLLFIYTAVLGGKCLNIKTFNFISSFLIIAPFITFIILYIVNINNYSVKKYINKFALVGPILFAMLIVLITTRTFEYARSFTPDKWENKEIRYLMYDDMISKNNIKNMEIKEIHKLLGHGEISIPKKLKDCISKIKENNQIIEVYNLGITTDTFLHHNRGYLLIRFDTNDRVIDHEILEIEIDNEIKNAKVNLKIIKLFYNYSHVRKISHILNVNTNMWL